MRSKVKKCFPNEKAYKLTQCSNKLCLMKRSNVHAAIQNLLTLKNYKNTALKYTKG